MDAEASVPESPVEDPEGVESGEPSPSEGSAPDASVDPAAFTVDDAARATAPAGRNAVRLVGCAPGVRVRVLEATHGQSAEPGAPTLDLLVVSTRASLAEAVEAVREGLAAGVPVAILAHPGAGSRALDLLANGASAIVHEGHEDALASLLDDPDAAARDAGMVGLFASALGPVSDSFERSVTVDPETGLPGRAAFEQRLEELTRADKIQTVVGIRVPGLAQVTQRMAPPAASLLLRRIAAAWRAVLQHDADRLHRTGAEAFAVLDPRTDLATVAPQLVRVGARYSPEGRPLVVGVGVAGPEDVTDARAAADVADRAAQVSAERGGALTDAHGVATASADAEALTSLLAVVGRSEDADRHAPGHGERVARYAVAIGRAVGLAGPSLEQLRVAAHVHDVGKFGLDLESAAGPDGLDEEGTAAYRAHAARGEATVRPLAGPEVAAAVRSHHEAWDGSGYPDGLEGDAIPLVARVIAVADAWDVATSAGRDRSQGTAEDAAQALLAAAGSAYDPDVVTAAVRVLAPHVDAAVDEVQPAS